VRPGRVWLVFAACAAALLGAMVWISLTVLRLERAEQQARAQAALEENTRLALWRLDSALIPLLAQEGRSEMPPEYLLRFQIAPGGEVTSPQAVPALSRRLDSLRATLSGADLAARIPSQPPAPRPNVMVAADDQVSIQKKKNVQEYAARQQSLSNSVLSQAASAPPALAPRPPTPREGAPAALWVGDVLLLARRVGVGDAEYIQGTWLDWPRLRKDLLASIQDLLPDARLEPVTAGARPDEERRLATLPVRLVTGPAPLPESTGPSPVRLSLAGAWAFAFLAALAVAALLRGVVELSERRHVFVSAVTHELRTPLTTFRLYTDMLADGMVTDEARRREYIARLRSEAERLGHLVENVLFYARIESGRGEAARETVDLQALVQEARPRLAERAARADLEMTFALPTSERVDRPRGPLRDRADPAEPRGQRLQIRGPLHAAAHRRPPRDVARPRAPAGGRPRPRPLRGRAAASLPALLEVGSRRGEQRARHRPRPGPQPPARASPGRRAVPGRHGRGGRRVRPQPAPGPLRLTFSGSGRAARAGVARGLPSRRAGGRPRL
jgi:signal transduction histidine kinase